MSPRVYFSFNNKPDNWRAAQVRNMGVVEGNRPATEDEWKEVNKGGDAAIKEWIAAQLAAQSAALVLIGSRTARRKWIHHVIREAWRTEKALLGVYVHNLKDSNGVQANKGSNPFDHFTVDGVPMSEIVKTYNPPYSTSTEVHDHIQENLQDWLDEAITIREDYN
ncbi:MAG: TIR domain-containing protein [Pseudomonadales bacterium]|jgi:hypothetical protein|nr:TIR domain-containing protein [Pseudomonadales bacterium]MDP7357780.1 TIR domain-containing protein [Pseudomonadales bacterium]MDP7595751.1 TIR domain-containing protein [Pseudomonadales bacterium]HJN51956.1 TIR domain-containing protein [Pseudomonadales bacterium]|tara:strand:+ start:82 stop:576 length:495 start_codon:yes stop_codon:yes gene_type:complete